MFAAAPSTRMTATSQGIDSGQVQPCPALLSKYLQQLLAVEMRSPWSSQRENVRPEAIGDVDAALYRVKKGSATLMNSRTPVLAPDTVAKNAQLEQRQLKSAGKVFPAILCHHAISAFVSMHALSQNIKAPKWKQDLLR